MVFCFNHRIFRGDCGRSTSAWRHLHIHGEYVGGLAAICQGTILNCGSNISINVSGTNSSGTYVGELTGQSIAVFNSRADGAITITDSLPADSLLYIGGLSGKSFESSYFVNNCSTVKLPASGGSRP